MALLEHRFSWTTWCTNNVRDTYTCILYVPEIEFLSTHKEFLTWFHKCDICIQSSWNCSICPNWSKNKVSKDPWNSLCKFLNIFYRCIFLIHVYLTLWSDQFPYRLPTFTHHKLYVHTTTCYPCKMTKGRGGLRINLWYSVISIADGATTHTASPYSLLYLYVHTNICTFEYTITLC